MPGTTLKLNDYGADNLLQVDPKFVDSAANDWHLLQNSPCVDSGDTLDWMWTAIDFNGERRVRNGVVDRGCYESAYHLGTTLIVK